MRLLERIPMMTESLCKTCQHMRQVIAIVEWQPDCRLRLRMKEFSPLLARLATGFDETWHFERMGNGTRVIRSFNLHAKSALTRPLLWVISILIKKAIARHLAQMRVGATP